MGADPEAIEAVYERRYGAFRNALAGITGSYETAHDVVQESFARALANCASYRGEGSLEAWIWTIAFRVALQVRALPLAVPLEEAFEPRLPEPERDEQLAAALQALPPRRRLMVFLRYVADLPYRQIADICEVSEGTVAATLAQAKAELARALGYQEEHRTLREAADR
jgi:RNA polymerase sigma-70 factor (ECF subfamily)